MNEDGTLKSEADLIGLVKEKQISLDKQTINTCGSGMTACIVDLALRTLGNEKQTLYDGSWTEYGSVEEPKFD